LKREEQFLRRRHFIQYGSAGLAALAFGGLNLAPVSLREAVSSLNRISVNFTIRNVRAEMVDLVQVPMWAFEDERLGPRIPGPAIVAVEGETLDVTVSNPTQRDHAFGVLGVMQSGVIAPGRTVNLSFKAPPAGAYLYLDPLNAPVNRVMGLHGPLIVLPRTGNTPYTNPKSRVQRLFDDLGSTDRFPGQAWERDRAWIWVFNSIDPSKNAWADEQSAGRPINAAEFMKGYLPGYFTINGKTGYFAAHDPEIMPSGKIGQPGLIRVLNAGVATHSAHIHGNHVFLLAENGEVHDNVVCIDTWAVPPGSTSDVLLPFSLPPDIPPGAWPSSQESLPFHYPVHCHTQMSQTAAGGNYPQGLTVHWMLLPD
jgi:FtsP/CotA-like multicopper oxidase with cupredoxin domain